MSCLIKLNLSFLLRLKTLHLFSARRMISDGGVNHLPRGGQVRARFRQIRSALSLSTPYRIKVEGCQPHRNYLICCHNRDTQRVCGRERGRCDNDLKLSNDVRRRARCSLEWHRLAYTRCTRLWFQILRRIPCH